MFGFIQVNLSFAQKIESTGIDMRPFADDTNHWYNIFDKNNVINPLPSRPRYKPTDLTAIGDNIILFQKSNGGWPKNYDVFAILSKEQQDSVADVKNVLNTTFDNGTTYTHIFALAQIYDATHNDKYKKAAINGLNYILSAQYNNGGWPQYYPLENNYSRHITFNDGVFTGILQVLQPAVQKKYPFEFIDDDLQKKLDKAFTKALSCVKKTQIIDNGIPTAWCQQHDEVTLLPAWGRKFEPPSICNKESADLVLFLMQLDHPDTAMVKVINNAVSWFRQSAISNTKVVEVQAPLMKTAFRISTADKVVVRDTSAPPIWTRYYELKTHRPLFCNRDSKFVFALADVERERRDGYAWYIYTPQKVLDRYPTWQKRNCN